MLATIKWHSRYSARAWLMMAGTFVVRLSALNAKRQKGETEPGRPPWKRFDDTHQWNSTAEEWVPDAARAALHASRRPRLTVDARGRGCSQA